MAAGGSTNLVLYIPAMARAACVVILPQDFADISQIVPLLAKVYPNGLADINHFHDSGGLHYLISQLLRSGPLHEDFNTIMGVGLHHFSKQAVLKDGIVEYSDAPMHSLNKKLYALSMTHLIYVVACKSLRATLAQLLLNYQRSQQISA